MVKVLVLFEDYNQMTLVEVCLKKIGFDVLSLTNDIQLADKMLGFPPDVFLISGKSSRVNSVQISQKLKENSRFHGKVVLGIPKDQKIDTSDLLKMKVDGMLEIPINPERLIQTVCKFSGLNVDLYLEKFNRLKSSDLEFAKKLQAANPAISPDKVSLSPASDAERVKRYQKFIDESSIDIRKTSHQREALSAAQENLKKSWDFEKLEELDDLRRKFAEALFKNKKK